jgi:hypothetical protein
MSFSIDWEPVRNDPFISKWISFIRNTRSAAKEKYKAPQYLIIPNNVVGYIGFYLDCNDNIATCHSKKRRQVKKICKKNAKPGSVVHLTEPHIQFPASDKTLNIMHSVRFDG